MEISVLVPIYNMELTIKRTIKLLSVQDEEDIEFILLNDGSTDGTLEIIKTELEHILDNRFRVIDKKNSGYGDTLNYGIKISKGKYIAIYEPDDEIENDFYHILKENKADYDVVKYNGIYIKHGEKVSKLFHYNDKEMVNEKELFWRFMTSHPSIINGMYKKTFIIQNDIWFCSGGGASYQDEQFRVSLVMNKPNIKIIDKCKYYYIQHDKQSIRNYNNVINEVIINWQHENKWLLKKKYQRGYFCFSTYRQMVKLLNNIDDEKKEILIKGFKNLKFSVFNRISALLLVIKVAKNLSEIFKYLSFITRGL